LGEFGNIPDGGSPPHDFQDTGRGGLRVGGWLCEYDNLITSNPPGPFQPSWDSLENYVVPEWYEDAKFGIFIHWGVYSVPAFDNEWYARNMYVEGHRACEHHRATYGPQDQFGYKDFIPQFTAPKFDANEWAELFAASGAKFVMPVAEHHDGFATLGVGQGQEQQYDSFRIARSTVYATANHLPKY
jgi:hypothetical protein